MKTFFLLIAITGLFAFKDKVPTKIIFFGDSITQAGAQPTGFISMMRDSLATRKPGQYELIGAGIGGNKIYDLYLRLEDDVLNKNPDQVVIWVGVNDVWHKATSQTGTDPDKFVNFYSALIKKFQARNIKVTLCTPASIGELTDYTNPQDGDLNKYCQFVRNLAAKYNCGLVDFRRTFREYNLTNNTANKDRGSLTVDGVHLNAKGNRMVADMLYAELIK
jgi:lysophospholipase L1-like esterase